MTGVAWILLLIGVVFMIGSFFVTEKLSPSELKMCIRDSLKGNGWNHGL